MRWLLLPVGILALLWWRGYFDEPARPEVRGHEYRSPLLGPDYVSVTLHNAGGPGEVVVQIRAKLEGSASEDWPVGGELLRMRKRETKTVPVAVGDHPYGGRILSYRVSAFHLPPDY